MAICEVLVSRMQEHASHIIRISPGMRIPRNRVSPRGQKNVNKVVNLGSMLGTLGIEEMRWMRNWVKTELKSAKLRQRTNVKKLPCSK